MHSRMRLSFLMQQLQYTELLLQGQSWAQTGQNALFLLLYMCLTERNVGYTCKCCRRHRET